MNMKILKDILLLNFSEDIKSVIDLEDTDENVIQNEIENYILTEGLSKHLDTFINVFTSNIKEKGVWISGFYGSGKSYFGKILGYLLSNKMLNGTSARSRFIPRLRGVANESILENNIYSLNSFNIRVVMMDIGKQNTTNGGLSFALFRNFLKSLGFLDDVYGYMEYEMFLDESYDKFCITVTEQTGTHWFEARKNARLRPNIFKKAYCTGQYSETDYAETKKILEHNIANFSAEKLREEINRYFDKIADETLVFMFDEASEAINQNKFNLLDLEAVSEALSSIRKNNVWTIAIAQEKLDDVISKYNLTKNQLIKVTDRFKTKLHLESTEVYTIIKNRLLLKNENGLAALKAYFNSKTGEIADATNFKSTFPTQTKEADEFAEYYPFHKYQFKLLQNFLFKSNALATTQIGARGMLTTIFDVLRKQLTNQHSLFRFCSAAQITREAQSAPPAWLVNKYENAEMVTEYEKLPVSGDKLLKTIHFLAEAELINATLENIVKAYISDISDYYLMKDDIKKALEALIEARILILTHKVYKITSDLHSKLLEEKNNLPVEIQIKRRDLIQVLKQTSLFNDLVTISENNTPYTFSIKSDSEDIIGGKTGDSFLNILVYSIYSTDDNRQDSIHKIKNETRTDKHQITIIPDTDNFDKIDKLLAELRKFTYITDKYASDNDPDIKQIIREFNTMKQEHENELLNLVKAAYQNAVAVYLYNHYLLNADTFRAEISALQFKLIANIFTKRLPVQLLENVAKQILTTTDNTKLQSLFASADFLFFDKNGNFIGDNLNVVEEITYRIKSKYADGKTIENELSKPPTGYAYGTILSVLATLLRAGKIAVKFNGSEYFSYQDSAAREVFNTGRNFQRSEFKYISKTLSVADKKDVAQSLIDLKVNTVLKNNKIDYNTTDIELVDAIRAYSEIEIATIKTLTNSVERFDDVFQTASGLKDFFDTFTAKTTADNYIDKAQEFIKQRQTFADAVKLLDKTQKFIKDKYHKAVEFQNFILAVENEYRKGTLITDTFDKQKALFAQLYTADLVANFPKIQDIAQDVKDAYYQEMKEANHKMTELYQTLLPEIKNTITDIENMYPFDANSQHLQKLRNLAEHCKHRIHPAVHLEFAVQCRNSRFSLSEIKTYIELFPNKQNELAIIRNSIITQKEEKPAESKAKKVKLTIPKSKISVKDYRSILNEQLSNLAGDAEDALVEIEIRN